MLSQGNSDDDPSSDERLAQADRLAMHWQGLIKVANSPLRLFALIVLICNSLFGVVAAFSYGDEVFIYTLHTFLAVAGSFALIALWSPRSFYSPTDIIALVEMERRLKSPNSLLPESRPLVPTIAAALVIVIYAIYQNYN